MARKCHTARRIEAGPGGLFCVTAGSPKTRRCFDTAAKARKYRTQINREMRALCRGGR